uniref:Uncharacterized protein n=1 Tax=Pseudictyota dubia TaxID=2749911 RepID=A0A7R9WEG9_9STRA|mmetsp:Transcript_47123/g.87543  ORF Transcript_47123/g.87543 Transcript_47123/m.87543 type:complete len:122 (+) Transcript_47123:78-443(+)
MDEIEEGDESIVDEPKPPSSSSSNRSARKKHKKSKTKQHSLDHLRRRVSDLMALYEERGLFVPLPESLSERGKVWSSRNYGADKKRQRKNAERQLLQDRIEQLERFLSEEHGVCADVSTED